MKDIPGTLQAGGIPFGTTHWSVVLAAADARDEARAQAALAQLCRDYWPPLYSYVCRRGYQGADAQDLVQGFFVHLLNHRTHAQADPTRGRFRAFLLGSFKNYLADEWARAQRLKRGGDVEFVLLDDALATVEAAYAREPAATPAVSDAEQLYEQRWAAALAAGALRQLAERYAGNPKARVFEALKPYLTGAEAAELPTLDESAAALGLPAATLRSYLLRLRARYRELLREEVARTVAAAEDVDEEWRYLQQVLIGAGGTEQPAVSLT